MRYKSLWISALVVVAALVFAGAALAQDADGDHLPDTADRCPTEPGPRENGGCPVNVIVPETPFQDRDGDGVADFVDGCPDAAGTGFTNGCPVEIDAPIVPLQPTPALVMIWDSTSECMVGVPLNAGGGVNVRQEPTTSSAVLGQLAPGQQFAPWFRDYDENNAVWFAGALTPNGYGWVAGSVVIDNGQCVNLPMVIHLDAPAGPTIEVSFDPNSLPQAEPDDDGWSIEDLLNPELDLREIIVVADRGAGPRTPGDGPPPTPAPQGNQVPGLIRLAGLNLTIAAGDGSVMPTDQKALNFAHRRQDGETCTDIGADFCLDAVLLLPAFGDGNGQCAPAAFARSLDLDSGVGDPTGLALLLPAVQKVREAASRAQAGDGSVMPGGTVMQDFHFRALGDGSVTPAEVMQDFHFRGITDGTHGGSAFAGSDACAMGVVTPGQAAGAADFFAVLLPAVQ